MQDEIRLPDISRRSFLGGALAISAAISLPLSAAPSAPVLYGDGQHDDTEALQALFDGKPIRVRHTRHVYAVSKGGHVTLRGGHYRISKPVYVGSLSCPRATLTDVYIENVGASPSLVVQ